MTMRAQSMTYSLPRTVICVEVDAVKEVTYAGPYAAYAQELLGLTVPQADQYNAYIKEIRMSAKVEADLQATRYTAPAKVSGDLLRMSSLGLVSFGSAAEGESARWSFAAEAPGADFNGKGITSQTMTIQKTEYKDVKTDTSVVRVAFQKDVTVGKSLEQKAQEAARMILRAREEKFKITIGDTDATFSGEALGAAIRELTRVEQEYLVLFTGYSVSTPQTQSFEVIPVKGTDSYDVFRLSDSEGLLAAEAKGGKPYYMDVIPSKMGAVEGEDAAKASKGQAGIVYRIPSVCSVTLGTGTTPLIDTRIPVYQMGVESLYITK